MSLPQSGTITIAHGKHAFRCARPWVDKCPQRSTLSGCDNPGSTPLSRYAVALLADGDSPGLRAADGALARVYCYLRHSVAFAPNRPNNGWQSIYATAAKRCCGAHGRRRFYVCRMGSISRAVRCRRESYMNPVRLGSNHHSGLPRPQWQCWPECLLWYM